MRTLSVGRSFRLVLLGLTIVLALLAGVGVAGLYSARRAYEADLSSAYALEAAGARMLAAGIAEEAAQVGGADSQRLPTPGTARRAFARSAARARALARDDPPSARLVERAVAEQRAGRSAAAAGGATAVPASSATIERLAARQRQRRRAARDRAAASSRRALIVIGGFGVLATALALLALNTVLAGLRRPIDELVDAAGRLAGGDLDVRVRQDLPGELAAVARAFNAMAGDLERTQRALAAERERLAVTVESLDDGLVVTQDGRVVELNPRAAELLGDVELGALLRAVPGLPDPLEALAGEVDVAHGRRTLAVTAARLGFDRHGLVWTVRDVSERVRLERLKSEFVATASHELRSPLTSIKGFIELLRASPGLSERQSEWVEIVLVSTNRLVDLVNDLLDVARVEAGRIEVQRRPTDVAEAAREVARLLEPRLVRRGQRLALAVPHRLPRAIADPARLRQVLTNLLTNAHQYTPDGGLIELRAAAVDGTVEISVADDGRGLTPEQIERVFDRFYRAAGTDKPGTGLGLAIVRSLVDLQGGSIDVESAPGAGTTFTVRLPRAPGRGEPAELPAELAGRRVLVVDDDVRAAGAIVARLREFGVAAVAAHDAEAAIGRLERESFDAITLDVLLAGASGFGVLHAIRDDPRLEHLPVLAVSAFSSHNALSGEWLADRPVDAGELSDALGAAVFAGRISVLAVAREELRDGLSAAFDELAVQLEWADGVEQTRERCRQGRFEVALLDAGLADAPEVLRALRLRGRRLRPSVLVLSGGGEAPPGMAKLDAEPLAVEDAGAAVLALLEVGASADRGH